MLSLSRLFSEGPKTLNELKEKIANGNTEWIDRLSYFMKTVIGSSSFWRQKKKEVYSWINYHLDKGNGRPNFFLRCHVQNINGEIFNV